MNILFLTLVISDDINERGIYNDLMRKFRDEGHNVFIISPNERRLKKKSSFLRIDGITIIKMKWLNIQKCSTIEKGISTLLLDFMFLWGIVKYLSEIKFDLIIYSTPPITFEKSVKYIKKRNSTKSYLLLKDIFPQNAVDMGLIRKNSLMHNYFRKKEKVLYEISDYIGCMSPANVQYLLKNNKSLSPNKVEVNPNSLAPVNSAVSPQQLEKIKNKFNIPENRLILLYGGNLGIPQGIDFLIQVLDSNKQNDDLFLIIVGSGTEFSKLLHWSNQNNSNNCLILNQLPKTEYDNIVKVADVGLIFLDKRFTIPNFPSRLLSYLENEKPVLLATDIVTDIGRLAEKNNFGFWSQSGNLNDFNKNIEKLLKDKSLCKQMGDHGYKYFIQNFTAAHSYNIIMNHFEQKIF
ncbi:MAG: glycosyltransferase family 4 protein [Bacteroidetes bacterium]|nr:glycosyltransferase family 4 protein [Bacteroidota bacterium]